jgi:glycosyltransferase involved in cell wall biosynthesis
VVAGELASRQISVPQGLQIEFFPGWLNLEELEDIIARSEVLLLPYSSASQSGLVDIASAFNTKIVATPVGGLLEQVANSENGTLAESFNDYDIAQAISKSINSPSRQCNSASKTSRKLSEVITSIILN